QPGEKANTPSRASATAGAIDEEKKGAGQGGGADRSGQGGADGCGRPAGGGGAQKTRRKRTACFKRKYTVEEDLFGDHRMVAPTVLGEDPQA
ncbi:hypothetical protein, partial [Kutzneria sp. 744]|uniref:hypothetical protein n=1 Tax=Kutzneria sp. (strain 744) TaxID=345341 RepID=UPI001E312650